MINNQSDFLRHNIICIFPYRRICLDEVLATAARPPNASSCLVYSFGVGHDFSFDIAMSILGCEVFAFDNDDDHTIYPSLPFPR